jgi:putative membrane protein
MNMSARGHTEHRDRVVSRLTLVLLTVLLTMIMPMAASAHTGDHALPNNLWSQWSFDLSVLIPLMVALWLYLRGTHQIWTRTARRKGVVAWRTIAFTSGILATFIALESPLDAVADVLLSIHMVQHLMLILVAAPLIVLGKPLVPMLLAVPPNWRRAIGQTWKRSPGLRLAWHVLTQPVVTGFLFIFVFLAWHVPVLYQAALRSDLIHALEHALFLGSALLFWWVVIQPLGRRRRSVGSAVGLTSLAMLVGSVLGALMTFSDRTWYPFYDTFAQQWGRTPLEDQQLAGLIMWIPTGVVYLSVVLGILGAWFHEADADDERLTYPLANQNGATAMPMNGRHAQKSPAHHAREVA